MIEASSDSFPCLCDGSVVSEQKPSKIGGAVSAIASSRCRALRKRNRGRSDAVANSNPLQNSDS